MGNVKLSAYFMANPMYYFIGNESLRAVDNMHYAVNAVQLRMKSVFSLYISTESENAGIKKESDGDKTEGERKRKLSDN